MPGALRTVSSVFTSGCVGGTISAVVLWYSEQQGLNSALGVKIQPALSPAWIYPHLIWGGIYGILLLLPIKKSRPFLRGLIISLIPSALQLLYFYPFQAQHGFLGLKLGLLTPLFILFFYAVWGLAASLWYQGSR